MGICAAALTRRGPPHQVRKKAGQFNPAYDSIKVMSLHSSKGLEFSVAALVGAGRMPGEDEREEARLFYVGATRADLPPASRTNIKFVKSVTMENDGHEKEQIYRRTNHWVLAASRSRHADQGVVPQRRF